MWPSSATATVLLARWACVQPVRGSSVEAEAGASLLCQAIGVWKMGNLKPHMKTAVLAIPHHHRLMAAEREAVPTSPQGSVPLDAGLKQMT